jgi:hypothetical protein
MDGGRISSKGTRIFVFTTLFHPAMVWHHNGLRFCEVAAYNNRRNAGSPRTVPERQRVDTARAVGHEGATASAAAI